jgi:photosystem II stability/assembly factor-like uncharacterized protein
VRFRPALESLEDRNLLSASIPLSSTAWTPLGPVALGGGQPAAGRIAALAADPTNANVLYVAAAGGGVWKTTDGGGHWTALTDNQATLSLGAIALAPSNPQILYAGTGEADAGPSQLALGRSTGSYGQGILKSTDGGSTWVLLGSSVFNRLSISRIVVDPADANTVYAAVGPAATNGLPGNTGVWKSTDGGATWTDTTAALTTTAPFSDLVMSPANDKVLYAAVGDPNGNTANGVYESTDGGATWAALAGFPGGAGDPNVGRIALAVAPSAPQTLYASVARAGANAGLYKMLTSADGGATWTLLPNTPNFLGQSGDYATALAVDPANANVIYAGGTGGAGGIVESTDGGNTWSDVSSGANATPGPTGAHHAFGFDASGKLLNATDAGLFRLTNPAPGSIAWTNLDGNLAALAFTGLALDPTTPNVAYGGSPDGGTVKFTDSLTWNAADPGGGLVRVSPTAPQTVYRDAPVSVAGPAGFLAASTDGGGTWAPMTNGINAAGEPTDFVPPLVLDPAHAGRLLAGTSRVYETLNGGGLWTPISTPGTGGWTASTAIDALATAGSNTSTVYAATQGHLFVTFNDGAAWQQIDIPGYSDHIAALAVDPTNNLVAYAVRDRFTGGPGGHVFKTTNGGATWTDISGNLPDVPVNALALDRRTGLVYAGTDAGVYVTNNGGTSWVALGAGLPNVRVTGLELNAAQNILAAATAGRGLWEIAVAHLRVLPSVSSIQAGVPFKLTVSALDPFNTVIGNGYTGTVHFTSSDGYAALPGDYAFQSGDNGLHTFAGVVLQSVLAQTVTAADTLNGAVAGSNTVSVTPYPSLSVNSVTKTIGTSGTTKFVFTVTLSTASALAVTVNYATADGTATVAAGDYQFAAGTLTFSPGQTSKTITVSVNNTTAVTPFKTFFVNLSAASHAILLLKQGTGTILNNNLKVSVNNVTVSEPATAYGWANFTVSLSAAASFPVTVGYAAGGGTAVARTHYVPAQGVVTFSPGQTTQTVSVPILTDPPDGINRTFLLTLSSPTNAVLGSSTGTCTILDTAPVPAVSVGNVSKAEGNAGQTAFVFPVTLSGPSGQTVTVQYATADGSAAAGTDYQVQSGTLTFSPGQTSKTLTVLVNGNTTPQPDRAFYVNLTAPQNATLGSAQGTGTILDDDPAPLVSVGSITLPEGNSGTKQFNFPVTLSSPSGQAVTVQYATADGSAVAGADYQAQSGTLAFAPGQTSKTVTVLVYGNSTIQPDKNFFLNVTGATGVRVLATPGLGSGVGTILNNDLGVSVGDVTVVQPLTGVTTADFPVTLPVAVPFPVTVTYATGQAPQNTNAAPGQDYLVVSGSVTFAPGQTTQTVSVPVFGEYYSEANETFFLKLTGATNAIIARAQGTATLINTTPLTLAVTNVTQLEGNAGTTAFLFTVTLTGAPHEQAVTIQYATADGTASAAAGDYQPLSGTLTLNPYMTKATITVLVNGNTTIEPDKTFFLNLTSAFGTAQGVGTIVNDDGPF